MKNSHGLHVNDRNNANGDQFDISSQILNYARLIGIDRDKEPELIYIAYKTFAEPLPPEWQLRYDSGCAYFYNLKWKTAQAEHPNFERDRQLVANERERLRSQRIAAAAQPNGNGNGNGYRNLDHSMPMPSTANDYSASRSNGHANAGNTNSHTGAADKSKQNGLGPVTDGYHERQVDRVMQLMDVTSEYESIRREFDQRLASFRDQLEDEKRQEEQRILAQFKVRQDALRQELDTWNNNEKQKLRHSCEEHLIAARQRIEREREESVSQVNAERNLVLSRHHFDLAEVRRSELEHLEAEKNATSLRLSQEFSAYEQRERERVEEAIQLRRSQTEAHLEERCSYELKQLEQRLSARREEGRRSIEEEHSRTLRLLDEDLEASLRSETEVRDLETRMLSERERVLNDLESTMNSVQNKRKAQLMEEHDRSVNSLRGEHEDRLRRLANEFDQKERLEQSIRSSRSESLMKDAELERSNLLESLKRDSEAEKQRMLTEFEALERSLHEYRQKISRQSERINSKENELAQTERSSQSNLDELTLKNESLEKNMMDKLCKSMQSGLHELEMIEAQRSLFAREKDLISVMRRDADQLREEVEALRNTKDGYVQRARTLRDSVRSLSVQDDTLLDAGSLQLQQSEQQELEPEPEVTQSPRRRRTKTDAQMLPGSRYASLVELMRGRSSKRMLLSNVSLASTSNNGSAIDLRRRSKSRTGAARSHERPTRTRSPRKTSSPNERQESPKPVVNEKPGTPREQQETNSVEVAREVTAEPAETEPFKPRSILRSHSSPTETPKRPDLEVSGDQADSLASALEFLHGQRDANRDRDLFLKAEQVSGYNRPDELYSPLSARASDLAAPKSGRRVKSARQDDGNAVETRLAELTGNIQKLVDVLGGANSPKGVGSFFTPTPRTHLFVQRQSSTPSFSSAKSYESRLRSFLSAMPTRTDSNGAVEQQIEAKRNWLQRFATAGDVSSSMTSPQTTGNANGLAFAFGRDARDSFDVL